MSSDQPDIYARTLAELARDPAFASFATPDAALLIWDAGATRLLAASPRAERLRRDFADAAGHLDPAFPARGRLQTLGAGLAPLAGLRLERLRLDGLSPPVTCACRRVMLDREPVLVTALLGPVPKGQLPPSRSTQENTQPAFSSPVPAAAGADPALVEPPAPAAPQEQDSAPSRRAWSPPSLDSLRCRGTVRIVWQADAEARFTSIAPALAAIVGPEAGDVVGRSWAELARSAVEDPGGAVADLLARRQTWSGRTVYWSVDGAPWRIPVDWAGLPVFGPDRTLRGFRGFGLLRAEAAEEREAGSAPANAARDRVTAPAPAGDPMPEAAPDLNEGGPTSPILPGEPEGHHPPPAGAHEEPEAWSADARQRVAPSHGGAPAPEPAAAAGRVSHGLIGRAERERSSRSAETLSRLSVSERSAFREIARALGARFPFEPQEPDAAEPGKTASDASGAAAEEPAGDGPVSGAIPTTVVSAAASESPSTATGEAEPASPGLRAPGPPGEPERSEAAPPDEEAETRFAAELVPEPDLADVETDAAAHPVGDASEFRRPQPPGEVQGDAAPAVTSEPVPPRPLYSPAPVHVLAVPARPAAGDRILDQMPVAALVHRDERVLFANRTFLDLVGCASLADFEEGGGLTSLFGGSPPLRGTETGAEPMALASPGGPLHAEVSVAPMEWGAAPATLILLRPERDAGTRERLAEAESARAEAERGLEEARARIREVEAARDEALERIPELEGGLAEALTRVRELETGLAEARTRVRELEAVLDTATDGVAVIDGSGRILSLNRAGEALFGCDSREVVGDAITVLLAPESHIVALDYLDRLRSSGPARLLNDGREVMGRVRQGGMIPLFMAMGPVSDGPDARVCAVLRDITAFKKAEGELIAAKRTAEEANAQKSDLLAKISHEIRTPLNAIIGFAEVMLEERFGPVGNERYKEYLKDVHLSGTHVISLVNDLLDLAKIEAGRMELTVTGLNVNELISASVALLQPQAGRERIVMRTSFAPNLPPVMGDERSVRQIALNLLSNAIKFTDPGGQVIVSTAPTDRGEVAFRVRDTGIGMSEAEIAAALEPFRQLATARRRGGTGLGLPLTKALVEANRGALVIRSAPNEGTLVEVLFPPMRVKAG